MGNEFKGCQQHSAEYFGDTRDHWWNLDFLELVAREWQVERIRTVLDVGCGVGHWGRSLARVLPRDVRLTGIDREAMWVEKAAERAAAAGFGDRFRYQIGDAERLPFEDGSFDLVTCQTVLMHLKDPGRALAEMIRVAKPGGLILTAEPTNVNGLFIDALVLDREPEQVASLIRFQLRCERGKKKLGEGDSFIGEKLPWMFGDAGLTEIGVRNNERCWVLIPPYESAFQKAAVEEQIDQAERGIFHWPEAQTRRYFLAGGGKENEFDGHWREAMAERRDVAAALRKGTYTCTSGGLFYLIWGWKGSAGVHARA